MRPTRSCTSTWPERSCCAPVCRHLRLFPCAAGPLQLGDYTWHVAGRRAALAAQPKPGPDAVCSAGERQGLMPCQLPLHPSFKHMPSNWHDSLAAQTPPCLR